MLLGCAAASSCPEVALLFEDFWNDVAGNLVVKINDQQHQITVSKQHAPVQPAAL